MTTDQCTCRECLEAEEFSLRPSHRRGDGRASKIFRLMVLGIAIVAPLTRSAHAQIRYTDENGQSPRSRYPPSTFLARPAGKMKEDAIRVLGSLPQTSS